MTTCKHCNQPTVWKDEVCTYCKQEEGWTETQLAASTSTHRVLGVR